MELRDIVEGEVGSPSAELLPGDSLYKILKEVGGFTVKYLVKAVDYAVEMVSQDDIVICFSFTANLIATGLRSIIAEFVSRGLVDIIFTTGGTVDHDIARGCGGKYLVGVFEIDDAYLRDKGIHRLGNIFIHQSHYGPLIEKFTHELLDEIIKEKSSWGVRELLWKVGEKIPDEHSILRKAWERKVPVYSPGVIDSAFGTALMTYRSMLKLKGKTFVLDVLKDMEELASIFFSANRTGGIILGGGISKHHLIWWSQFADGLDYAIYMTTAVEWDGSLSGAQTREAITWGKVKPEAKHVTVYGDATLLFPLFLSMLYSKIRELGLKRKNREFNFT